jgi:endonuclease III
MKRGQPKGWQALYAALKVARAASLAPVDTIGCDKLQDKDCTREDFRYQTLVALMLSAQTKDEKTAEAMQNLRSLGCNAKNMYATPLKTVNENIKCVGFHNRKAQSHHFTRPQGKSPVNAARPL